MGRIPCCQKEGLKKGPWTPEEDQKLIAYIEKHGHENWRALPKRCGLLRCGKSCRLRWTNYLRPDIKRGRFSQSEEQKIIQLHALVGNKWSFIASQLPKRTDNEIKNYWNTVLKKRMQKISSMFANAQRLLEQKPSAVVHPPAAEEDHNSSNNNNNSGTAAATTSTTTAQQQQQLGSWTSCFSSSPASNVINGGAMHSKRTSGGGAAAAAAAASSASSNSGSSFSHLAQWESARLQAEARLARESKAPAKTIPNSSSMATTTTWLSVPLNPPGGGGGAAATSNIVGAGGIIAGPGGPQPQSISPVVAGYLKPQHSHLQDTVVPDLSASTHHLHVTTGMMMMMANYNGVSSSSTMSKAVDLISPFLQGGGGGRSRSTAAIDSSSVAMATASRLGTDHHHLHNNNNGKLSWNSKSSVDVVLPPMQLMKNLNSASGGCAAAAAPSLPSTHKRTYWQSYPAISSSYRRTVDADQDSASAIDIVDDDIRSGTDLEDIRSSGSSSTGENHHRHYHQLSVDAAGGGADHDHHRLVVDMINSLDDPVDEDDDEDDDRAAGGVDGAMMQMNNNNNSSSMMSVSDLESLNKILAQMEQGIHDSAALPAAAGAAAWGFLGGGGGDVGELMRGGGSVADASAELMMVEVSQHEINQHTAVLLDMINCSANHDLMNMTAEGSEEDVDVGEQLQYSSYLGGLIGASHHHHHHHHEMHMGTAASDMMLPKLTSHHYDVLHSSNSSGGISRHQDHHHHHHLHEAAGGGGGMGMVDVDAGGGGADPPVPSSLAACFHLDVDDDMEGLTCDHHTTSAAAGAALPALQYDSLVRQLLDS